MRVGDVGWRRRSTARLRGQGCHTVDADDTDGETQNVVLGCGCRTRVPRSTQWPIGS
jgi:hypothetical protein